MRSHLTFESLVESTESSKLLGASHDVMMLDKLVKMQNVKRSEVVHYFKQIMSPRDVT